MNFFLTLAVGAALGLLFFRIKVPGGMMVGALVGAVLLNVTTGQACMPYAGRLAAQITAGAFIGATLKRSDVARMPKLVKPAAILIGGLLVLNVIMGTIIHYVSGLDWMTSFFCVVPGGMSDVPIIAAELGANSAAIVVLQFSRMLCGVGLFPSIILFFTRDEIMPEGRMPAQKVKKKGTVKDIYLTVLVAALCGLAGKLSGVPVGAMLFTMIGVGALKLFTERAYLPLWLKRAAQVLSGTYVGSTIGPDELLDMGRLILPAVLLLLGYLVNCVVVSKLLHRFCGLTRRESMLAATPAGASDMALISGDLGIANPDLNVLQIIRLITAVGIFPQFIRLVVAIIEM